jgi:GT2 family glycosyltransferase
MEISVVVGTYNRLELLKKCITSILAETSSAVKVYVTDAGSTDGTVEHLKSIASDKVIPIFVGKKLGQAKAYNDVFSVVDTPYVCWLSDDNVVINRGLDTAVEILKGDRKIGMVGLKVKDVVGPFVKAPYIGGLSSIGILNVNQGVLPTGVLKELGGFSEEFQDYGIDPDLTARVLFSGHKVVYTKDIAILHHRGWAEDKNSKEYEKLMAKQKRYLELYEQKYAKHAAQGKIGLLKTFLRKRYGERLRRDINKSADIRDWYNILNSRYIGVLDKLLTSGKKYHLVQSP